MRKEQLDYFAVAYETPSFAAAAEKIPMSSQGFTKAIQSLERELGIPLFVFEEDGLRRPTAYADELVSFVRKWQSDYSLLCENFDHIKKARVGRIHLGTSLGIIGFLGPDFLKGFETEHAGIKITYSERTDAACEESLRSAVFDLALTIRPYDPEFTTTNLYHSEVRYWVNKNNPLSTKKTLTIADLSGQRVAIPGEEFKCYLLLLKACKEAGVEPPEITQSRELFWIYEFALDDKGLGFCPQHLAELPIFKRDDRVIDIPLEEISWDFGISRLPLHMLTEPERLFIDYCIAYTEKLQRAARTRYKLNRC